MKLKYLSGMMLLAAGVMFTACSDDDDNYSAATMPIVTEVNTGDAVVTAVSAAIAEGIVKDLSAAASNSYEVGVVYGTATDPTQGGTRVVGSYRNDTVSTTINGLTTGVTYYYATYVFLQDRVYKYGDVKQFTTTNATATTGVASDVSYTKATLAADFAGLNGLASAEKGIKVGLTQDVDKLMEGPDYQVGTVNGLLPGATYHYMSYVKVGNGYVLGEVKNFTTKKQEMEYVDLGLSVLWAKYNLGAEQEQEVGTLFGYGDRTGVQYSKNPGDYPSQDIADTEFDITNSVEIDGSSPMLSAMPTLEQVKELIAKTTKKIETQNGVKGVRFTAANGNSIFLPYTGYRNGKETIDDGKGFYWTGTVSQVNNDYANTLTFDANGVVKNGNSLRSYGIALRTVRPYAELKPGETGKLAIGDLENNGNLRIEIYNEYGSTKGNSVIDPSAVKFNQNMVVTFKISGLNDNYKADASKSNIAGLEYAAASWEPSHWSSLEGDKYDANVTGDGTYSVWMDTDGTTAEGAAVFCVDIKNLAANLVDPSKVKVELVGVKLDADVEQPFNQDIVAFNNKDGNEVDGRIEIYNEFGTSGATANGYYNGSLNFTGTQIVNFTISGIDGNLKADASKNYRTELSYADQDWDPSYWGGSPFGRTTVSGDGTYEVFATLNGECAGAVVWTIELYDLWKDLVDTSKVAVTINSITTPCKN